ncbi:MAG TPA: hypothetical protein VKB88_02390 [Bryobacteraceae bacterium]|nr:hypothetical protein [Bryobacteraceae bacterium]
MNVFSRRTWLQGTPLLLPWRQRLSAATPGGQAIAPTFPAQPLEMVKEMVTVSHGNLKRVRELVEEHASLAKAAWDWGFGDWETALGAASHTGSREIAELLISKGARPTLFSAAMLGQLAVVKAFVAAQPGAQQVLGPHSIPLLTHAKLGGPAAAEVYRYLEALGDAGGLPSAAITEEDIMRLSGTYVFGGQPADRIEIGISMKAFCFTRHGATARPLYRIAGDEFRPAGAEAVRIRFAKDGGELALQVYDPALVLTARRVEVGN